MDTKRRSKIHKKNRRRRNKAQVLIIRPFCQKYKYYPIDEMSLLGGAKSFIRGVAKHFNCLETALIACKHYIEATSLPSKVVIRRKGKKDIEIDGRLL